MKIASLVLPFLFLLGTARESARGQEITGKNFLIAPSVLYYSGLRSRSSNDERAYLVYDTKVAYKVYSEVFLGLTYQIEEDNTKTSGYSSSTLNNTSKTKRTSFGPSVGYVTSTFHFMFTYFFESKWSLNTTTSTGSNSYTYSGAGLQLDAGYKIPLWGFFFGPQISYKKFTYEKLSTDGASAASISPKLEETGFEPSLVFFLFF